MWMRYLILAFFAIIKISTNTTFIPNSNNWINLASITYNFLMNFKIGFLRFIIVHVRFLKFTDNCINNLGKHFINFLSSNSFDMLEFMFHPLFFLFPLLFFLDWNFFLFEGSRFLLDFALSLRFLDFFFNNMFFDNILKDLNFFFRFFSERLINLLEVDFVIDILGLFEDFEILVGDDVDFVTLIIIVDKCHIFLDFWVALLSLSINSVNVNVLQLDNMIILVKGKLNFHFS